MRELHAMPRTRMRRVRRVALQDRTAEGSNHLARWSSDLDAYQHHGGTRAAQLSTRHTVT